MWAKRCVQILVWEALLPTIVVWAQTGTVRGKILDEMNNPVPFANVVIENSTLGVAANASGEYVITNVPPGEHTLRASAVGYKTDKLQMFKQENPLH